MKTSSKLFFTICVSLSLIASLSAKFSEDSPKIMVEDLSKENHTNIIQVAIIGGGIGGLGCAQITARRNLHTVVFQGDEPGGALYGCSPVYNWLGVLKCEGLDVVKALKRQALHRGAILRKERVVGMDLSKWPYVLTLSNGDKVSALSVVIATGSRFRKLGVPGEEEYAKKGIVNSVYRASKDWRGRRVVVVGGGDDATRKAEWFAKYASKVYLVVRDGDLNVAPSAKRKLLKNNKNIKVLFNSTVSKIYGDQEKLQGVEVKTGNTSEKIACDIVSVGIGIQPNNELFKSALKCDKDGWILLEGRTQKTSLKGVFAVGDITEDSYKKAVAAGPDGIKAGYEAANFLHDVKCDVFPKSIRERFYSSTQIEQQKAS